MEKLLLTLSFILVVTLGQVQAFKEWWEDTNVN
jgi:hypothetical protein